jgi:D-3-phosphoglycerate dehydrogenase
MAKILVSDSLSDVGIEVLRRSGLDVDLNTGRSEDELVELIKEYDALIVRSATKVTARILEAGRRLKIVGRAGVGVDNVDVGTASRHGVIVMNTPLGNITSAAEHAVAMLLSLARNIPAADASMKAGKWDKKSFTGVELAGKLLGVIGMGKVGQIVARAAKGIGMDVCALDPFLPERRAKELGVALVDLEMLLTRSDIITVHTPLTDETRGLIGAKAFSKMKPGVRLVNCARGGIVDEAALVKALETGKVAGAALDVFGKEPLPADSPLRKAPNLILTPHLGASTEEAQAKVSEDIAHQIVAFFKEGKIQGAVNLSVTLIPELEPYAALAETLGRMVAQLMSQPPQRLTCSVRGRIASMDIHALSVYALKGLLANWQEQDVNLVNATLVAQERGLTLTEDKTIESPSYANLLRIEVGTDTTIHSVSGTVFEGRENRVVDIDGFTVDLKPEGIMLVMFYPDKPGMVGKFGTILGRAGINIAGMDVGRKEKRGRACIALSVDDPVPLDVVNEIRESTGEGGEVHIVRL